MPTHRRTTWIVLFAVALLNTGCDRIETMLLERGAARGLAGDRNDLADDGKLNVVLCGTGSPVADAERAGPCTAVLAGGHFFLVDAGPGSSREVALLRLPRARLDGILLTHFHSDHVGEVGEATVQSWIAGRTKPLAIYGPPGVDQIVDGFRQVYAADTTYRVAHHGEEFMPQAASQAVANTVALPSPDGTALVFEADGLKITAFRVDHGPVEPAYGYRFDYGGRSVVVSGDTKKNDNLIQHAKGADLLVHEALGGKLLLRISEYASQHGMERWGKLTGDIVNYHTTPAEAAEVARAASVQMLVLTHIVPPLQNFVARRMFLAGASDAWNGEIVVGTDGSHFALPKGSKQIDVDNLR